MALLLTDGAGEALTLSGETLSVPYAFIDTFTRADANAPGNGWSDLNDLYPTSYDASGIDTNALSATAVGNTNGGHQCVYQDFGISDNFHIRMRWLAQENWVGLSALNQVGPALFVDEDAPLSDLEQGIQLVPDFTLAFADNSAWYFNNMPNEDAETFNDNYETHSLIYDDVQFLDASDIGIDQTDPYVSIDVWVRSGNMKFAVNGIVCPDITPIPAAYVGRTSHGIGARTGSFPVSRVVEHFAIRPFEGNLP